MNRCWLCLPQKGSGWRRPERVNCSLHSARATHHRVSRQRRRDTNERRKEKKVQCGKTKDQDTDRVAAG